MQHKTLSLSSLRAHPDNANMMPKGVYKKLLEHIKETGQYPPIIVRPMGEGSYEILDGHHRVQVLEELKHDTARCEVWEVDADRARLLLATLNRLAGRDDPHRRAALLAKLRERWGVKALAARLPEDAAGVTRLLELAGQPDGPGSERPLEPAAALGAMPVVVHFFLLPAQRQALEARLRAVGGTRDAALMAVVCGEEM